MELKKFKLESRNIFSNIFSSNKGRSKSLLKLLFVLISLIIFYSNSNSFENNFNKIIPELEIINLGEFNLKDDNIGDLENDSINLDIKDFYNSINPTKFNVIENISNNIKVVFCPSDECYSELINNFNLAKSEIICAFYDLDNKGIINSLINKSKKGVNISIIIDDAYLNEKNLKLFDGTNIDIFSDLNREGKYNNYMHNKFCVIDRNVLITGSTNPTDNGLYKNNNNLIIISSKYLSKNYLNEFNQMRYNKFGKYKRSVIEYNNITLVYNNERYLINSYFCPEDNCAKKIVNILNASKERILFATFSFTENSIEDTLTRLNLSGINVEGILEKRNSNGKSSICRDTNLKIYLDSNKYNMHNKYFIIDNSIIITGSMNPSNNGNKYNDENILIIKNQKLNSIYYNNYLTLLDG